MTQPTTTTTNYTTVEKSGDWVLPVKKKDGTIVYALQINKSKEDKENIDAIVSEYQKAGIEILGYKGKEDKLVLLVDATQKIRSQKVGVKTQKIITGLMAKGFTEEEARAFAESVK